MGWGGESFPLSQAGKDSFQTQRPRLRRRESCHVHHRALDVVGNKKLNCTHEGSKEKWNVSWGHPDLSPSRMPALSKCTATPPHPLGQGGQEGRKNSKGLPHTRKCPLAPATPTPTFQVQSTGLLQIRGQDPNPAAGPTPSEQGPLPQAGTLRVPFATLSALQLRPAVAPATNPARPGS